MKDKKFKKETKTVTRLSSKNLILAVVAL